MTFDCELLEMMGSSQMMVPMQLLWLVTRTSDRPESRSDCVLLEQYIVSNDSSAAVNAWFGQVTFPDADYLFYHALLEGEVVSNDNSAAVKAQILPSIAQIMWWSRMTVLIQHVLYGT